MIGSYQPVLISKSEQTSGKGLTDALASATRAIGPQVVRLSPPIQGNWGRPALVVTSVRCRTSSLILPRFIGGM